VEVSNIRDELTITDEDDVVICANGEHVSIADLDAVPEVKLRYGSSFCFSVIRHGWASVLAEAWARTRDERYAQKLVGSGNIVNMLHSAGENLKMPATWTEHTGFVLHTSWPH